MDSQQAKGGMIAGAMIGAGIMSVAPNQFGM